VAAILLFNVTTSQIAKAEIIEGIAAVVGKDIILRSRVDERLAPVRAQIAQAGMAGQLGGDIGSSAQLRAATADVLKQLADETLIASQADKMDVIISEKELNNAIQQVIKRNNIDETTLKQSLEAEGKSIAAYKKDILRPQLERMRVINLQVRSHVNVTEDEVRARYQQSLAELDADTKYDYIRILVSSSKEKKKSQVTSERANTPPPAILSGQATTEKILADIANSIEFSTIATHYSIEPNIGATGGLHSDVSETALPSNFSETLKTMAIDEIRGPLQTANGVWFLKLVNKSEGSARPFDEVKDEMTQQVFVEKMEAATESWMKGLRKRAFIRYNM